MWQHSSGDRTVRAGKEGMNGTKGRLGCSLLEKKWYMVSERWLHLECGSQMSRKRAVHGLTPRLPSGHQLLLKKVENN